MGLLDLAQNLGQRITGTVTAENGDSVNQSFQPSALLYEINEAYYDNSAYETINGALNGAGRALSDMRNGLYRATKGVYNPFRRAVDWYPGSLYPGVMTDDGLPLADGTPCCVPFDPTTDERLRLAAITMLTWGNWEAERYVYGRSLPKLGDAFGEIEIDYERGKAYPRLHHPRFVTNLQFNGSGDVIAYTLQIPQVDSTNVRYTWGKVVTKDTVTTLKDGEPFAYGEGEAVRPNDFGFTPAAWVQFRNDGGQHGQSLVDGVRGKVDRLNSSASSIHDYIAKFSAQGVIFKTDARVKNGTLIPLNSRFQEITDQKNTNDEINVLFGPADLTIDRLIQNLGLGDAMPYLQGLIDEIEADLPEAVIDREMRANPQMSGVSRRMTYGDVAKRHAEACGNADGGLKKLIQMGVGINGRLMRSRAFGLPSALSDAQRLFLPFDVDSYEKGDLAFSFTARQLFPDTPLDRVQVATLKEKLTTPAGLQESGYSLDEIYGEGLAPKQMPGLLDQRQASTTSAGNLFGNAFNQGAI